MADVDEVARAGLEPVDTRADPLALVALQNTLQAAARNPVVGFPFGNPVSFEWRHQPQLRVPYRVAPKTNGVRVAVCLGLATRGGASTPAAFVMDRNCAVYGLVLDAAPLWVFSKGGTLLDAELVPARTPQETQAAGTPSDAAPSDAAGHPSAAWEIVIFDAASVGGVLIQAYPLSTRLEAAAKVAAQLSSPTIRFSVKRMVALRPGLTPEEVLGPEPRLPSDGFVLTPEYAPASTSGTAEAIFKLKDPHTLDVLWADTGLWYGDGSDFVSLLALRPDTTVEGLPSPPPLVRTVVELAIEEVTDRVLRLRFVGLRPGKRTPNNVRCVVRTLVSAQEHVALADIVAGL